MCAHGFGSLKIKISQSISDVFMFSSYIFADIHVCHAPLFLLHFHLAFFVSVSAWVYSHLSSWNAYIMCANVFCWNRLLITGTDGWCSLPLPIEINMLSMFFIITRCSGKKPSKLRRKKREKKTSEISANHVESCTHKCACTKRIFTRQQRHTHDTRRRRQRRCKQWKMVMEHFSNWAYQTPAIYPRWMAHQQKKRRKRDEQELLMPSNSSNLLINNFHNHLQHVHG